MTVYRFYRIHSLMGTEEYIGSTKQPLSKRYADHTSAFKKGHLTCRSRVLFEKYGVENCLITLIEEHELPTLEHALREERRIMEERKEYAVNRHRPIVSSDELKQERKELYITHREEIAEFYKQNRDRIKARCLKYYHENKQRIKPKLHREVECPICHSTMKYMYLSRHKKGCSTPSSHTSLEPLVLSDPLPLLSSPSLSTQESPCIYQIDTDDEALK